ARRWRNEYQLHAGGCVHGASAACPVSNQQRRGQRYRAQGQGALDSAGGAGTAARLGNLVATGAETIMSELEQTRVALVTGAARGIGKGVAVSLLRAGWGLVLGDVDEATGLATADGLGRRGSVEFAGPGAAGEASVRGAREQSEEAFGRLDAVVNSAGLSDPDTGPLERLGLADWNRMLA